MSSFVWKPSEAGTATGNCGLLQVTCSPLLGLCIKTDCLHLKQVLGLEIVDAIDLGPQKLTVGGAGPDIVIRQDTISVQFAPTTKRPVECVARWRVLPEGIFDLEVSTLTPGKWDGLAVQTCSSLPVTAGDAEIEIDTTVEPGILIYRPLGIPVSYIEFCHPHDGIGIVVAQSATETKVQQRLFGHDLEKGVILRGRLRGMLAPRAVDTAAARAAYDRFLAETPNLAL